MPEITNNTEIHIDSIIEEDDRETMIKVENVGMTFNMASEQLNSLKEYAIALFKRNLFFKELRALNDISFEVKKGDVYGIVGTNGSGKSTLLKIVAGVLEPTDGKVTINGSIAPLIELGAGFDMELTARENIYLNGALLGYSNDFIDEHFDAIVEFAEIDKFLDMPMKNYSSGMVARIAFAIATVIVPEILIVDEVLSVGDFMFQKKCEDRIQELIKDHGTTVLIVSHSIEQVQRLCNKAIWIEKGKTRINGTAEDVCSIYSLIGGRTGSLEAEKTIIDAHIKTKDIVLEDIDDYYYDSRSNSACEVGIDLIKRCKNLSHEDELDSVVLVPSTEHTYITLGNAIAGSLNCPLLTYNKDNVNLILLTWLDTYKPRNIYIIDRLLCNGTEKLINYDFNWDPNIILSEQSRDENQLSWNFQVIDSMIKNITDLSNECFFISYSENTIASAGLSKLAYSSKTPIFSCFTFENPYEGANQWEKKHPDSKFYLINEKDFLRSCDNKKIAKDPHPTEIDNIAIEKCEVVGNSLNNEKEAIIVPYSRELFPLYATLGYYSTNAKADIIILDNTNLESIKSAYENISSSTYNKITTINGETSFSKEIINLLLKTMIRKNRRN